MMKNYGIPVAAEGWPFILPLALAAVLLLLFGWKITGIVTLVLAVFVLSFFRDPERAIPQEKNIVVSPADGRVIVVKDVFEPDYLKQDVKQISIFMSVFNVHVNRSPVDGTVESVVHHPGRFHVASVDKASLDNEQTGMVVTSGGRRILVKQIAGLIARRIICYARPGDRLRTGERFGLIRFGSRVDIFLPKDADIKVKVGDRVKGALDILAKMK